MREVLGLIPRTSKEEKKDEKFKKLNNNGENLNHE
jgi:hypothetical protein